MGSNFLNQVTVAYEKADKARGQKKADSPVIDPKKAAEFEKGFNESVSDRMKRLADNAKKAFSWSE